ncbi:hypothetical protein PPYR_03541 [Photinus pyralis]|uniref:C2H2-type domain-containing protein n=1 Tax=Photinus pyralis TaxID=7054 RepID=A0A5N4A362_PHOPY|nr:hypothetical protein PPYR_03541 [Photinus pyralis]
MEEDDGTPIVKIEPEQENEITSSLDGTVFVSNNTLVTIKDEITLSTQYCQLSYNENEQQQTDCSLSSNYPSSNDFKCNFCTYTADSELQLKQHREVHKGFKCYNCDFTTKNKHNLKQHCQQRCIGYLTRAKCNYGTNQKSHSQTHLVTQVSKGFKLINYNDRTKSKDNFRQKVAINFMCAKCDYGTNKKNHFVTHQVTHVKKDLKCINYNYRQSFRQSLSNRVSINYKCANCNYGTHNKHHLEKHVLTHMFQTTNFT